MWASVYVIAGIDGGHDGRGGEGAALKHAIGDMGQVRDG